MKSLTFKAAPAASVTFHQRVWSASAADANIQRGAERTTALCEPVAFRTCPI
ncbi:hypothetical protein ABIA35_007109 [Catenulispora sp. MAP12-49]